MARASQPVPPLISVASTGPDRCCHRMNTRRAVRSSSGRRCSNRSIRSDMAAPRLLAFAAVALAACGGQSQTTSTASPGVASTVTTPCLSRGGGRAAVRRGGRADPAVGRRRHWDRPGDHPAQLADSVGSHQHVCRGRAARPAFRARSTPATPKRPHRRTKNTIELNLSSRGPRRGMISSASGICRNPRH